MKTKANENNRHIPNAALRQRIEERAYQIWLASDRRHGDHERHWFEAERELMETAKQEREQRSGGRGGKKTGNPHKIIAISSCMKNQLMKEKGI